MAQNTMVDVNNPENPEYNGARNPDDALYVRFYERPRHNAFRSEEEQRPIYDMVIYIEINTPGNPLNVIDTPARPEHERRFPRQWAWFKNNNSDSTDKNGTPLSAWPALTAASVEELKHLKFFTIEQIAMASDDQIQRIGMHAGMQPHIFRQRANSFLQLAKDAAVNAKQASEIEALKAKDAARDREMAELRALLENKTAPTNTTAPKSTETITVPAKKAA